MIIPNIYSQNDTHTILDNSWVKLSKKTSKLIDDNLNDNNKIVSSSCWQYPIRLYAEWYRTNFSFASEDLGYSWKKVVLRSIDSIRDIAYMRSNIRIPHVDLYIPADPNDRMRICLSFERKKQIRKFERYLQEIYQKYNLLIDSKITYAHATILRSTMINGHNEAANVFEKLRVDLERNEAIFPAFYAAIYNPYEEADFFQSEFNAQKYYLSSNLSLRNRELSKHLLEEKKLPIDIDWFITSNPELTKEKTSHWHTSPRDYRKPVDIDELFHSISSIANRRQWDIASYRETLPTLLDFSDAIAFSVLYCRANDATTLVKDLYKQFGCSTEDITNAVSAIHRSSNFRHLLNDLLLSTNYFEPMQEIGIKIKPFTKKYGANCVLAALLHQLISIRLLFKLTSEKNVYCIDQCKTSEHNQNTNIENQFYPVLNEPKLLHISR